MGPISPLTASILKHLASFIETTKNRPHHTIPPFHLKLIPRLKKKSHMAIWRIYPTAWRDKWMRTSGFICDSFRVFSRFRREFIFLSPLIHLVGGEHLLFLGGAGNNLTTWHFPTRRAWKLKVTQAEWSALIGPDLSRYCPLIGGMLVPRSMP